MSEQSNESKNKFKYRPTTEGCCDIFMESTDTEEIIKFPTEIDGLCVTGIGYQACKDCKNVKTVIVPEGVLRIHSFAFCDCPSLVRIHIPSTLTENRFTWALFYGNDVSLITCSKDIPHSWELESDRLPPKRVQAINGESAGKQGENGTVGIYTVWHLDDSEIKIVYQRNFLIRAEQYPADKANEALEAVQRSYKLICKTVKTYDVYSSDGVDPNDRDEFSEVIDIKLENLVFSEDGECCGVFYTDSSFKGIMFFDGSTIGEVTSFDRKLCYGHPLDFYINTSRSLTLIPKH